MQRRAFQHKTLPSSRTFVSWTLRHGRTLWIIALLLAIPALVRTVSLYLHLKSDLEELLPRNALSVTAIQELRTRMPGLQYLGVLVDTGTRENLAAGEHLVDELAARVRKYPPELARSVRTGVTEERSFLEKNAPLYMDLQDLKEIRTRVEARRDYEVTKEFGADLENEDPPSIDFTDIEKKYDAKNPSEGRFPTGRFSNAEQHLTLLLIEVGGFSTGAEKAHALFDRVRDEITALGGTARYAPGMRIGYTGDVAISVEEMSALVADLTLSSVLVIAAVITVIVLYYRWWRSVLILLLPLLLATLYAFALATLPPFSITELNSNTAFLGSIIVGNGINFGIVLLARYTEERRGGVPVQEALVTAISGTRVGTLSAALAAGVAYSSLVITQFRGFRQFGIIGGLGMVLCWLTAFVLTPPLVAWLDATPNTAPKPIKNRRWMTALATGVARNPKFIVAIAMLLTAGAIFEARHLNQSHLEYDFSRLRRADTWVSGEGFWGRKMDQLLGQYLSPTVVLTDASEEARIVGNIIRGAVNHPPLSEMISVVRTVEDILPSQSEQEAKIRQVTEIRNILTPKLRALIPSEKRSYIDRFVAHEPLHVLTEQDLPQTFTTGLRERDGALDRVVLVYPRPVKGLWEGTSLSAFIEDLRALCHMPDGPSGRVAGSLALSADILASIRRDGPRATLIALLGVIFVVILLFRRNSSTLFILGSLLLGVLWLVATTVLWGIKINFVNFIAFPITFGIGVDYSVNVMARYVQDGSKDVLGAVRSTGSAVGLCSLTTIIGYSSLLVAQNRALYSFGLVAVLGEIACLTTAVVVLPAVLLVHRELRAKRAITKNKPHLIG